MIAFRSDTVTRPCDKMRQAMYDVPVGYDVYGDDPTVNKLQTYAADMIGIEDALFVPTGTMSNLCTLMSHCARGEEFIAGHDAHCYYYEGGNAAVFGSIQSQTLQLDKNGMFNFEALKSVIKPDDVHFAISKLLCI